MSRRTLTLAAIAVSACTSGPPPVDNRPYEQQVQAFRAEKDVMFRTSDESPLPLEQRATFTSLPYFAIDPAYRVPAILTEERSARAAVMTLDTSTNQRRQMRKVGVLGFAVIGVPYKLTAFADIEATNVNRLFVPFGDLTNGSETYGGGRYLELERTPTGLYDLDFNRAYHPSCVFDVKFDCPVPPSENRLPVAIKAGERLKAPPPAQ